MQEFLHLGRQGLSNVLRDLSLWSLMLKEIRDALLDLRHGSLEPITRISLSLLLNCLRLLRLLRLGRLHPHRR